MSYYGDKVAVITGAGSGIGRELARLLAAQGARLALSDIDDAGLAATRQLCGNAEVRSYRLDVSKREHVFGHADDVKRAAYREGLKSHREDALLSRRLVTLRTDAPVTLDLETFRRQEPEQAAAHALFKERGFQPLARE